uniref:hypothetical protein n=1 Tax=uncultured Sphingomonas sp. TaxID=158754 RepID=UPI0035CAB248
MNAWDNETEDQTRIRVALINHTKWGGGPSAHNPWAGTPVDGSRWTAEQLAALKKLGKDPEKVWWHDVPLWVPDPLDEWGVPSKVYLRCPKITQSRDRSRVLVIAPDGVRYWTEAQ